MNLLVAAFEIGAVAVLAFGFIAVFRRHQAWFTATWLRQTLGWLAMIGVPLALTLILACVILTPESDGHKLHPTPTVSSAALGLALFFFSVFFALVSWTYKIKGSDTLKDASYGFLVVYVLSCGLLSLATDLMVLALLVMLVEAIWKKNYPFIAAIVVLSTICIYFIVAFRLK